MGIEGRFGTARTAIESAATVTATAGLRCNRNDGDRGCVGSASIKGLFEPAGRPLNTRIRRRAGCTSLDHNSLRRYDESK